MEKEVIRKIKEMMITSGGAYLKIIRACAKGEERT